MTLRGIVRAAATICLLLGPCDPAFGQSVRSAMGPEARTTIIISASVIPTFKVTSAGNALNVASNAASRLRYVVVMQPVNETPTPASTPSSSATAPTGQRLVLIVPD